MPAPKKRIKVRDKKAAVARLSTESIEQVAAGYGVTTMTVRNWVDTYGTPVAPRPAALPFLQQSVQTVPLPPELETPKEEPGGDGGLNAARVAAGMDPEPEPTPEATAPPPEAKPEAPKIDPVDGLVFMSKVGLQVSVRFYAARLKVKMTDEVKAMAQCTPEEEEQLKQYAPFAAPFMSELITKYGPIIGAGIFGFIYFTMLTDRFAALKELAPKKTDARVVNPEPEPAAV